MKNEKRTFLVLLLTLGIIGLAMLQYGRNTVKAAPAPQLTPVIVTNAGADQSSPVPVSGSVSITGTPTVSLANDATSPWLVRDVDRPAAQPFNYYATLTWVSGYLFANADKSQTFTVPTGKRLVIEFVSLQSSVPSGDKVMFARLDSSVSSLVLSLTDAGVGGDNTQVFTATHRVFSILDPGTTVTPTAYCGNATDGCAGGTVLISVSGYLVNAN
jgi:hypothetical protein